mmetsp:Transcript_67390/g.161624  ORF Transcript_67390/g.161624 Transcript_67390/m.161624 type:complete len:516 (+) Transcript_67390:164-1711(+)|eukprot:CAMPEP_0178421018 /NCGR_PEP_ID=MMETSP0689_2-20121128/26434_1 /TAXON_ID=160604 /ORGANISM="Amphidinium massartii, Strain CS-259" /LENGTH=515 /DNA_ID=CAMNT_0020042523 /DNA_START=73 /DNA_END=1620 /DNA_ORIENTATION=-
MASSSSGVVVKNTFLEVADHKAVFERDDIWRRYASEPGGSALEPLKVEQFVSGNGALAPLEEPVPELLGSDFMTGDHFDGMGVLPEERVVDNHDRGGVPSSVLLLAESIRDAMPSQRPPPQESERREKRENQAHVIKDVAVTQQKPPWKDVTTVMMRNLPNKYTQQMLLEELQEAGFTLQQDFDFFYLPMDHHNAANLGYCFINFCEPYLANLFSAAFEGKKMKRFNSSKTVVVMPASIQGYEKNYQYYSSTRVVQAEDPQYRPLFLRQLPSSQASSFNNGKKGKGGKEKGGKDKGAGKSKNEPAAKGQKAGKESGKSGKGKGGQTDPAAQQRPPAADMYSQAGYNDMDVSFPGMGKGGKGGEARRPPAAASENSGNGSAPSGTFFCPYCGYLVQSVYQFCPQCGANLAADIAAMELAAANSYGGAAGMRAEAPVFVPPAPRLPMPNPQALLAASAAAAQSGYTAQSGYAGQAGYKDPVRGGQVTDELDVMRGRMMLLAVLKDMEKREGDVHGNV